MERGAQQITVDDFTIAECTRIPKQGGASYFQADGKTVEEPATLRGDRMEYRAKQAI